MSAQPQYDERELQDILNEDLWRETPDQSAIARKSRTHYLFVAVDDTGGKTPGNDGYVPGGGIDCSNVRHLYGFGYIQRGKLLSADGERAIRNHTYINKRAPIEDERDAGSEKVGPRAEVQYAEDICHSLVNANRRPHPGNGLRIISSLIDVPRMPARWIQHVLLSPVYQAGILQRLAWLRSFKLDWIPPEPQNPDWQGWALSRRINIRDLVAKVLAECIESCEMGHEFLRGYYSGYIGEMKQTLIDKFGVNFVSPKMRFIAEELGLPTPDDLATQSANALAQQGRPVELALPKEIVDLLKAGAEARGGPSDTSQIKPMDYDEYMAWKSQKLATEAATKVTEPPDEQWERERPAPEPTVEDTQVAAPQAVAESGSERPSIEEKTAFEEAFEPPKRGPGRPRKDRL